MKKWAYTWVLSAFVVLISLGYSCSQPSHPPVPKGSNNTLFRIVKDNKEYKRTWKGTFPPTGWLREGCGRVEKARSDNSSETQWTSLYANVHGPNVPSNKRTLYTSNIFIIIMNRERRHPLYHTTTTSNHSMIRKGLQKSSNEWVLSSSWFQVMGMRRRRHRIPLALASPVLLLHFHRYCRITLFIFSFAGYPRTFSHSHSFG